MSGPRTVLLSLLVALAALGLAACGGDDAGGGAEGRPAGDAAVTQPYPPVAQEPPPGPEPAETPPGRIVEAGARAEGVAVDPRSGRIGVMVERTGGDDSAGALRIFDAASGRRTADVELPGTGRHLQVAPEAGGPFLVPIETANQLWTVPTDATSGDDGRIEKSEAGDHPHDATWLDGASYTADEFGSTVTEVRDGEKVRTRPVDVQPGGIAAVGDQLAIISVRAYTVELLRKGTLLGGGAQSAGRGPSHVVSAPDGRLYIADTRGRQVLVYETDPRLKFVARIPLQGSPLGLAVDARRDTVWATLTDRNQAVAIATGRPDEYPIRRTVPTVQTPASLAVVPATGRLAIASSATGELQLVDP